MADYDVGALALTTPPAQAVITSYRPAVSVRNNGIHDALASGTLRIYKAGLLVFTTEIYSPTIPPGETRAATATDYWTPPSVGTYQVIAYVSCPLDQYEPNNSLAPTLVTVTAEPPPPPPPVALHASQHEEGGLDEISVDGLAGKLAEKQEPLAHATDHQLHGPDEINVTGLPGLLADPQTPEAHGNERHTTLFITPAGLAAHNAGLAAHEARRGVAGGFAGLDAGTKVPPAQLAGIPPSESYFLRADQTWQPAAAGTHHTTHESGGGDEINVGGLSGVLAQNQVPKIHAAEAHSQTLEDQANKGAASGYPALDETSHVPPDQLGTGGGPGPPWTFLRADKSFTAPDGGTPAAHKSSHQTGGDDELSVAALHGVLADAQPPAAHASTHQPNGADPLSGFLAVTDFPLHWEDQDEHIVAEAAVPANFWLNHPAIDWAFALVAMITGPPVLVTLRVKFVPVGHATEILAEIPILHTLPSVADAHHIIQGHTVFPGSGATSAWLGAAMLGLAGTISPICGYHPCSTFYQIEGSFQLTAQMSAFSSMTNRLTVLKLISPAC